MFNEFNSWLFYLGVFSGSAYLLGLISQIQKKKTFFYFVMTFIGLALPIVMAAYRSSGTDSFLYMRDYIYTRRVPIEEVIENITGFSEAGHKLLTKFLGYFKSVRVYFGAYAAITLCVFYIATKEQKKEDIALPMFLFYFGAFVNSFNIMRQTVAVVLIAFSFQYVFKRDFLKFMLCVLVAATFHLSALVVTVVYFLWTKNKKMLSGILLLVILAGVAALAINLDKFLGNFSESEFESASLQRYVGYTTNDVEAKNRDFYLNLLISAILMVHYSRLVKVDNRNALYIYLFFVGTALGLSGFVNPYA